MKIIEVEQGSQDWLDWRKSVITATDCSCIMGSNPWTSEYKCWQRKLGLIEEVKSNEAMERGKRLEPIARDHFMKEFGIEMKPVVVESTEFDFLGASLDGISLLGRSILEIKCGGNKLHDMAKNGKLPEYYMHQMQHQLLVTGVEKCFYYSFDGKEGICIEVFPDLKFQEEFMVKARKFWKNIAFHESPALTNSDYRDRNNDSSFYCRAQEYKVIDARIKEMEKEIKEFETIREKMKLDLISKCDDESSFGGGIKIMKTTIKGRISYDDIPDLKSIDLDKYRKPSTESWKIIIEKDSQ